MRGQLEQMLLIGQRRNVEVQVMPLERSDHPALGGPFTLIETTEGRRIAYVEVHKDSRLHTERRHVRELEEQYGLLRAQALTPRESLTLVEKLLGEMNTDQFGPHVGELAWFKSSYSSGEGGECVEVAPCRHAVHVRDSKDTARPGLTVDAAAWTAFVGYAVR